MADVTLRDYIDTLFREFEKRANIEWAQYKSALELASKDLDRRLDTMNRVREQLLQQAETFASKAEMQAEFRRLCDKIEAIEKWQHHMEGKASQQSVMIAWVMSALGLLTGIVGLVLSLEGG
jgi:hypothetical protein